MRVPLSRPDIQNEEIELVNEVLKSNWLSMGPKTTEFEERMAEYAGVKHCTTVNSGTSGLHLIVRALGIEEGDEVITTPFSFVASSNCILFERAKPVFVDIDPVTYNIDPSKIEAAITEKTKAILPVHVFGQPAEMDAIMKIAQKHNLHVIEDGAEAIGAEYKGQRVGTFGDACIFAFYPNKQMTTGEGGVIITNNEDLYAKSVSYKNQGRGDGDMWLSHQYLGYNYRIDEMSAALGIAQLKRLDDMLQKREEVAQAYTERLKGHEKIITPKVVDTTTRMSWFVYVIRLTEDMNRDEIMEELNERGVGSKPYFSPIHLQPFYRDLGYKEGDYPVCEAVGSSSLALPFFNNITDEQMDYVCNTLFDILDKRAETK